MKNLINAITKEKRQSLEDFIGLVNVTVKEVFTQKYGYYSDLIPKGKDISQMSLEALKAYLISRKEKQINKSIEREVNRIKSVMSAGKLTSVKISVEWIRSRMWGANPKAECWYTYTDKEGNRASNYITSESISGCGYDKLSTAVAQCLNQINEVLKPLYIKKDKVIKPAVKSQNDANREIFGYGSGYGILPSIEGGVGVSCYPRIFESIGFKFQSVASGKSFDVFEITKN